MSDFYEPSLTPAQWKQALFQEPNIPVNDDWTPSEPRHVNGSARPNNGHIRQPNAGWNRRGSNDDRQQNRRRY
ncbi:hypothetical protein [Bifidobacterium callitrichidarum]|uniref:hypothetical protein n=1 Tax=Bifidobacterium callitrichidarum TaxID=2052941 RepID=UPI0011B23668|nr:hypothetical protein [Bifidobacterium callitrichidarum]